MTQGKIERWHLTLKNRILLENYYLPGQLLTPADVYFGRGQTTLLEREKIKRQTIQDRRLYIDPIGLKLSDDGHDL
jgi:hypothetical protein